MTTANPGRSAEHLRAELFVSQALAIAADIGVRMSHGMRVLDFGCGEGDSVAVLRNRGYEAWGTDIESFWSRADPPVEEAVQSHLRLATLTPYHLPFEDAAFDLVLSSQVFEHVMDYEAAFRELRRVLRPGALSIHQFPHRWRPIENHVKVPLATMVRARPWLAFWAMVGIRNEFQAGLDWREVAARNHAFLTEHTAYPSNRDIKQAARRAGVTVSFEAELYLRHHPGSAQQRIAGVLSHAPGPVRGLAAAALSAVTQRLMVVRRA